MRLKILKCILVLLVLLSVQIPFSDIAEATAVSIESFDINMPDGSEVLNELTNGEKIILNGYVKASAGKEVTITYAVSRKSDGAVISGYDSATELFIKKYKSAGLDEYFGKELLLDRSKFIDEDGNYTGNGQYTVTVTANDGATEATAIFDITVSLNNQPSVILTTDINNIMLSNNDGYNALKLTGKAYDADGDPLTVTVKFAGIERAIGDIVQSTMPESDNWEIQFEPSDIVAIAEGAYTDLDIVLHDGYDEVTFPFTGNIIMDVTPPVIPVAFPSIDNTGISPSSIEVKVNASDNFTDVVNLHYTLQCFNDGKWENVAEQTGGTELTHNDLKGNMLYQYRFIARDLAGNETTSSEINKYTRVHDPVGIRVLGQEEHSVTFKVVDHSNNAYPAIYLIQMVEVDSEIAAGPALPFPGEIDSVTMYGLDSSKEYKVRIIAQNIDGLRNDHVDFTIVAPELEISDDDIAPGNEKEHVVIDLPELPVPPISDGVNRYEYKLQDTPFLPKPLVGTLFGGTTFTSQDNIHITKRYLGVASVDSDGRIIAFKQFDFNDPSLQDKLPKFERLIIEVDGEEITDLEVSEGLSKQLVVTALYSGGHKEDVTSSAVYEITDTNIATVSNIGLLNALTVGFTSIKITATIDDITKEVTLPVEVTPAVPTKLTVAADKYSIELGQKIQVSASLTYSNGVTEDVTDSASWTVSNTSKAIVIAGEVTGKSFGDVTVTAQFDGFSDSLTINIKNPPPILVSISVAPNSIRLKVGETQQLTTTAFFSDGSTQDVTNLAKYFSEDSSVVAIEGNGVATCIAVGQTRILVEVSGKQVSIPVEVEPIAPKVIDISAIQNVKLEIGEIKPIKVVAYLSDGTTKDVTDLASFTSQNSGIASVVRGGIIKGIAEGVTSIYIDYANHNVLVSVTVIKDYNEEDDSDNGGKNDSNKGSDNKDTDSVTTGPQEQEPPTIPPSTPEPDIELPIVEPWQPVGSLQPELEKPIIDSSANNANPSGSDNGGYGRNTNNNKLKDNIDKGQNTLTPKYGTVFGRITDTAGRPMSNIRVELHSKPRITYSDNNGWYRFENVELGNHTIFINDDKLLSSTQVDLTVKQGLNEVVLPNTSKALLDLSDDSLLKEVNFVIVPKDDANSATDLVYDDNMKNKTGISINKIGDLYAQAPTAVKVTIATTIAGTTAAIPLIYWPRRKKNVIIRSGKRNVGKLTVQAKRTLVINITNQLTNFDTIQVIFKANLLKKMKDKTIVLRFGAKDIAYFVVTDQTTGLSAKVVADTLGVEWHSKEDNKK